MVCRIQDRIHRRKNNNLDYSKKVESYCFIADEKRNFSKRKLPSTDQREGNQSLAHDKHLWKFFSWEPNFFHIDAWFECSINSKTFHNKIWTCTWLMCLHLSSYVKSILAMDGRIYWTVFTDSKSFFFFFYLLLLLQHKSTSTKEKSTLRPIKFKCQYVRSVHTRVLVFILCWVGSISGTTAMDSCTVLSCHVCHIR